MSNVKITCVSTFDLNRETAGSTSGCLGVLFCRK